MRELEVHAASAEEALREGSAALGVSTRLAQVEVLESDEHGVTARVWVTDEPEAAAPPPPVADTGEVEDEDIAEAARLHLDRLLELMGVQATAHLAEETDDEVTLEVVGDDLGVVIGNFGQTLNAVQFLVNIMVNRRGRRRRINVDAEGYRERRRLRLEEIAHEHARRAKEERREVILEGLRASERRIIHTALQHDPDVSTYSEGESPHRRLIISPRL